MPILQEHFAMLDLETADRHDILQWYKRLSVVCAIQFHLWYISTLSL